MGCGCGKKQANKNIPTNRALPSRAGIVGRPPIINTNLNPNTNPNTNQPQLNMQQQEASAPVRNVRSNSPYGDKERIQKLRQQAIERAKGKRIF